MAGILGGLLGGLGALGGLFGGSEKSASTLNSTQKNLQRFLSKALYRDASVMFHELRKTFDRTQKGNVRERGLLSLGATEYGGNLSAGLSKGQQELMKFVRGYEGNNQTTRAGNAALRDVLSGQAAYNLDPTVTQNRFQNSVVNPAMRAYEKDIAPRIQEAFAGIGGMSSRSGTAQAEALTDMQVGFSSQLSDMMFQNQALSAQLADNAAQRQVQGVGLAQQQQMQPLQMALIKNSILGDGQKIEQQRLDRNYSEFLRTSPENNPWMQYAMGMLGVQSTQPYLTQNPLQGAATGGLSGLLLAKELGLFGKEA